MITIEIGPVGLDAIYSAGRTVALAHRIDCSVGATDRAAELLAWQVFAPMELNTVEIDPAVYCFATTTALRPGAVLAMNSLCPSVARPGTMCLLEHGHFATQPLDAAIDGIAASSAMTVSLIGLGLARAATINGDRRLWPACVRTAMRGETVLFRLAATVEVFLSGAERGGTIVASTGTALQVNLDADTTLGFDSDTNRFFQTK